MRIALLLFLVACGGDDADPHALGACVNWTDNLGSAYTGMCEAACKSPPVSTGKVCDTKVQLNCVAIEFSGEDGCCVPSSADNQIKFVECASPPK
jgi:hypothetical protein